MRFLILAVGRSGSSQLADCIHERIESQLDYLGQIEHLFEPFNVDIRDENDMSVKGKVITEHCDEWGGFRTPWMQSILEFERKNPDTDDFYYNVNFKKEDAVVKMITNKWHTLAPPTVKNAISFYDGLVEQFDKTILLNRRDMQKKLFSTLHAYEHDTWGGEYKQETVTLDKEKYNHEINDFFDTEIIMYELMKRHEDKVIYMEDLFTADKELSYETWKKMFPEDPVQLFESLYNKYLDIKHKKGTK